MIAPAAKPSQVVIFGLGGQGILFVTKLLAEAAVVEGRDVIVSETHGMSQRGGAVESHVKFGGYEGPLVRRGKADVTVAVDAIRAGDAKAFLRPGGQCFVNGAPVEGARALDALAIAQELKAPRAANIATLGFAVAAAPEFFPRRDAILAALERLSPPKALEANRRAFLMGAEKA